MTLSIGFIGGGNMARAILSGLQRQGSNHRVAVLEPNAQARQDLLAQFACTCHAEAGPWLSQMDVVVWAVKPQQFDEAARAAAPYAKAALHVSVAAGIRLASLAQWLSTSRLVRVMPNTPALIGQGMAALVGADGLSEADRDVAQTLMAGTGQCMWLSQEDQLDAVTALSGSGPAYVFYFIEAMILAGTEMGLSADQAHRLAVQTFVGASALARDAQDAPQVLRQRVTSKGGTTHAAISVMEDNDMRAIFIDALYAARDRAAELAQAYGPQAI